MEKHNLALMVIDDDPGNLEALTSGLENAGFSVRRFSDPREALKNFEKQAADVVISDYQLPGMDGLDLLDKLKTSRPDLPFVLMTATPGDQVIIRALNRGARAFFHKPMSIEELLQTLNEIHIELDRKRRHNLELQTLKFHYSHLAQEISRLGKIIDNLAVQ